jgi:hypothetical protein
MPYVMIETLHRKLKTVTALKSVNAENSGYNVITFLRVITRIFWTMLAQKAIYSLNPTFLR